MSARKTTVKPCKCLDQVNSQLKDSNAMISQGFQINFKTGRSSMSPPMLATEKIDSKIRKRLPSVICSFCPFCGAKYPE